MPLPQLRRVRWAVRATLVLGVAASVVANVLHARDNPISQAIAAWPPLALLLTVELISRVPVHRKSLAAARLLATATIAGIAAWVSYWHMVGVAARYGETGASPYLLPLSVDGLIVVASICLVELGARIAAEQPATKADPTAPATAGSGATASMGGGDLDGLAHLVPSPAHQPAGYAGADGAGTMGGAPPSADAVRRVAAAPRAAATVQGTPAAPAPVLFTPPPDRPADEAAEETAEETGRVADGASPAGQAPGAGRLDPALLDAVAAAGLRTGRRAVVTEAVRPNAEAARPAHGRQRPTGPTAGSLLSGAAHRTGMTPAAPNPAPRTSPPVNPAKATDPNATPPNATPPNATPPNATPANATPVDPDDDGAVEHAPASTSAVRASGRARPRRSPAETVELAERIRARRPDATDDDLAAELGITTARLRAVRREAQLTV